MCVCVKPIVCYVIWFILYKSEAVWGLKLADHALKLADAALKLVDPFENAHVQPV